MSTIEEHLKLPYTIILRPDDEGDWVAEIDELEGCIAHGSTQEEALRLLEEAKTLWIEESLAAGQPVPKPNVVEALPSGKWVQRIPRSLHLNLIRLARVEGVSLNQLVAMFCAERVGVPLPDARRKRDLVWTLVETFNFGDVTISEPVPPVDLNALEKVPAQAWVERDPYAKTHKH